MRNRKKRTQREEVRRILHEVRLQLAAQRMAQEHSAGQSTVLKLNELFNNARKITT